MSTLIKAYNKIASFDYSNIKVILKHHGTIYGGKHSIASVF